MSRAVRVARTSRTSRASKHAPQKDPGVPHMPFNDFTVRDLDHLLKELERAKPAGATVEVSTMEESHHSPCMQEMQAIIVQTADAEGQPVQTHLMYQYCPTCKIAVRVL